MFVGLELAAPGLMSARSVLPPAVPSVSQSSTPSSPSFAAKIVIVTKNAPKPEQNVPQKVIFVKGIAFFSPFGLARLALSARRPLFPALAVPPEPRVPPGMGREHRNEEARVIAPSDDQTF